MHPREGGRKILGQPVSRRDFLRRSAITAASIPTAGALLAACGGKPGADDAQTAATLSDLARRDNPITYDINEHNGDLLLDPGQKPEGGPLEIFNWEEYINPRVISLFEEAFGVQINVTTYTTMVDAVTKLSTREQNYDVIMGLTLDFVGRLIQLDLLRPLQHSYLPNLEANIWPSFSSPENPFYDVGSHYTVPYTIFTTGVGYRIDKGPTDHITMDLSYLEDAVPAMDNPWDLLWDPKFKGYSHMMDDYRDTFAVAMLRKGHTDINTGDPAIINAARDDVVEAIKTVGTKFDVNDYVDMPEGRAYVHQAWSGDLVAVQWYYPSWSARDQIRYWVAPMPPEKGPIGSDVNAILANGKNPVLAHNFLNYLLDFDNALINFMWNGYAPPLAKITSPSMLVKGSPDAIKYAVTPPGLENCIPKESDFINGVMELELTTEVDNLWKDAWEIVQTT